MSGAAWTVRNDTGYYLGAGASVAELPVGIFKVQLDDNTGQLYCSHVQSKFPLPDKIYDLDTALIRQVITHHRSPKSTRNLGVLLAGLKGSGKTITAKMLCNELALPVLLLTAAHADTPSFINDIKQDVIVLVDEYEKIFSNKAESMLLSLMDGALDNGYKRVFLLTINELSVSHNLIERPGRIRYCKSYTDLPAATIKLILNDMLEHRELYVETFKFITELRTITIDIIKAIVDEVNVFGVSPYTFKNIFNVKFAIPEADLYEVDPETGEMRMFMPNYPGSAITKGSMHTSIGLDGYSWRITGIVDRSTFTARSTMNGKPVVNTFRRVERDRVHASFVPRDAAMDSSEDSLNEPEKDDEEQDIWDAMH